MTELTPGPWANVRLIGIRDAEIERLKAERDDLLEALTFMISNCSECDGNGVIYDDDYWTVGPTGGPCPICQGARECVTRFNK